MFVCKTENEARLLAKKKKKMASFLFSTDTAGEKREFFSIKKISLRKVFILR